MAESKAFASLSSSLLARKGAAKPAMRPQGFGQGVSLEDLGWNDMGSPQHSAPGPEPFAEHVPSSIAALTPSPRAAEEATPVHEQQRAIEESFAPKPKAAPAPRQAAAPVPAPVIADRRGAAAKPKAAFTLRLDQERHLKLRLACAVTNRSAQQIVTQAVDEFLAAQPELDAMLRQAAAGSRN